MDASREMERRPGRARGVGLPDPAVDGPARGRLVGRGRDRRRSGSSGRRSPTSSARMAWSVRDELLVHKTPITAALDEAAASDVRPFALRRRRQFDERRRQRRRDRAARGAGRARRPDRGAPDHHRPRRGGALRRGRARGDDRAARSAARSRRVSARCVVRGTVTRPRPGRRCSSIRPGRRRTSGGWPCSASGRSTSFSPSARRGTSTRSCYRHVGLDPARYQVVQVKSAGGFRARYEPIAAEIVEIETTGPCDSDLTRLPFRRIPRPLWPFDPELDAPWAEGEPVVTTAGRGDGPPHHG